MSGPLHVSPADTSPNAIDALALDVKPRGDFIGVHLPLECVNLPHLLGGQFRAESASVVLGVRDRLKVGWIDASFVSAEMVDLQSRWNWPDEHLIDVAMGIVVNAADAQLSIPRGGVSHALPLPASGFGSDGILHGRTLLSASVTLDKPDVLTANAIAVGIGSVRDGRRSPAPAHAQAGRVGTFVGRLIARHRKTSLTGPKGRHGPGCLRSAGLFAFPHYTAIGGGNA